MSIIKDFMKFQKSTIMKIPENMIIPAFAEVHEDMKRGEHTEYVFSGGRGSTKSSFCALSGLEIFMNNPEMHWLVCRQVQDTLKDSVYAQIEWAIEKLGRCDEFIFKKSPLEIMRKATRQRIYFRGADDPMKIKSIKPPFGYIGILWFEELDQFKGADSVRSIEQSAIRGGDRAYIIKSFNPPKTSLNWANEYVKIPKRTQLAVHNTYLDVPREWLGATFIEEAEHLRRTKPEAYEHEYLGVANGTGGAVFENVIIRHISDEEIALFDHIYRGIDWGWFPDPNRYIEMHYDRMRRRLYIYAEVSANKTSNEKFADMILQSGGDASGLITADSAERKSISDFKSYGFFIRGAKKGKGSVEMGIKWLCSLDEIIIDNERCPRTAEEFAGYEYERDANGCVVTGYPDKDNHSIDAVRYAMERVIRKGGE